MRRTFPPMIIIVFIFFILSISGDPVPSLPEADRMRLAEAFRLANVLGDQLWKDWSQVPFAVLLVTQDHEFLIRHPKPPADFVKTGHDSLLSSDIYFRKRVFNPEFQATFPIEGIATVVIGQAEKTQAGKSTPWVLTVLHEHFHQFQMSDPEYYKEVDHLELSRGDTTGMWMLNFPFPYET